MARGKRDEFHIDDSFDMVDVAMAMLYTEHTKPNIYNHHQNPEQQQT